MRGNLEAIGTATTLTATNIETHGYQVLAYHHPSNLEPIISVSLSEFNIPGTVSALCPPDSVCRVVAGMFLNPCRERGGHMQRTAAAGIVSGALLVRMRS